MLLLLPYDTHDAPTTRMVSGSTYIHINIDMRQCSMSLLALNVGINNVNPVITEVLKLVNKCPAKLPSYGTLQQMYAEGRSVSTAQIGEVAATAEGTTLHYDGTSKFGHKYIGFQLSSSEGQLTMSVSDVTSGSAEHTLILSEKVIGEPLCCWRTHRQNKRRRKATLFLRNTMKDRAAVNTKFNELLDKYQQDVLSAVIPDWDQLSGQEKASRLSKMNNHCRGLHMLMDLAEQCNAVLREYENSSRRREKLQRTVKRLEPSSYQDCIQSLWTP